MKKKQPLVSIVIPGRNSGRFLESCFRSISNQTYQNIEVIVVDSFSKDNTVDICKKYKINLLNFDNSNLQGRFDATYKRNMGARFAKGKYIYYIDADFELSKKLITEAVNSCENEGYDAVIVRELPFGKGYWTACKALEQDFYAGDDNVEAPRFYKKTIWESLNGLDSSLGAGCDDWDMYLRFREHGFKVKRIKSTLDHNEGEITIRDLFRKGMLYGRDVNKFIKKRPTKSVIYFFPLRYSYIKNWKLAVSKPHLVPGIILSRLIEYAGGMFGIFSTLVNKYS